MGWTRQAILHPADESWTDPSDLADQLHRWDVDDVSTATSGGEITQVDDLVGSADLTDASGTYSNPKYISADTLLGGRAAAHIEPTEPGVDGRALYSTSPSVSQNFTFWMIARLVDSSPELFSDPDAGNVFIFGQAVSTVPRWTLTADGASEVTTTNGQRATPGVHLIIVYVDDGAPTIEIDGITCALDGTTIGTGGLSSVLIGSTSDATSAPEWLWTMAGIVSGDMSSGDRADLLAWAVANAGVVTWTPALLSAEGYWHAGLGHAAADGGAISSWANQGSAGSALDVVQATGGLQPTFDAALALASDQPAITFVSAGDVLASATTTSWHLPTESSSMTLVVGAICSTTATSGFEALVATRTLSTQGGFDLYIRTGSTCRARVYESGATATISDAGGNATQNTVHVLAAVLTGAVTTTHDSLACWVDGVSAGATTADLDLAVAAAANRELCFGGTSSSAGSLSGYLLFVIFLKRLLTSDEDDMLAAWVNQHYAKSLTGVTQ